MAESSRQTEQRKIKAQPEGATSSIDDEQQDACTDSGGEEADKEENDAAVDEKRKKHKKKKSQLGRPGKPGLESVSEQEAEDQESKKSSVSGSLGCGAGFGVKSYLHQFYEAMNIKNPGDYEEMGYSDAYLIKPKRRRCNSIWWKVGVWCGVNFLIFGLIALLVGYLVSPRDYVMGEEDTLMVIDPSARKFNYNLDICKLVGLVIFCVGGALLIISLLFPSFLHHYCDDDLSGPSPEPFKIRIPDECTIEETVPKSPTELLVPVTERIKGVQPKRSSKEAVMTSAEGAVRVQ